MFCPQVFDCKYFYLIQRTYIQLNGFEYSNLILILTAATGAKNHRHESRTDEDVYLYLRTCSA